MIQPNEIRPGNWINLNNKPCQVNHINGNGCGCDETFALFEDIHPILITDHLLRQTGFVKDLYGYKSRQLALNQYDDVYYLRLPQGTGFGQGIRYVHQLQNLYYDISGKEYLLTLAYFDSPFSIAG